MKIRKVRSDASVLRTFYYYQHCKIFVIFSQYCVLEITMGRTYDSVKNLATRSQLTVGGQLTVS
jgi:ATP phosphoribosyltransferase regulatory subunit HisZ